MSPVYNENEFRVLYGVPVAIDDAADLYYTETKGEINGLAKDVVDAMAKRYVAYVNSNEDKTDDIADGWYKIDAEKALAEEDPIWDVIDETIFVNGEAVSFRTARNIAKRASTAPYKAVDNDNDGTVDALFISDYTIGTVKAIDGTDVTVNGLGLGKIALANAADLAVGDYVAVWSDTDGKYAKKLDVKEANVTGYDGTNYTIGGEKKVFGGYMSDGSKSLVLSGSNAITDTVYKYVFDGKYIVNVELTENTKFAKYALVEDTYIANALPTYLGYPMVRLYTQDNESVIAYVKTVDGTQIYPYQTDWAERNLIADGELVTYELDGDYVYINTVDANETFEGNTVSTQYDFTYNRATGTWEGVADNNNILDPDNFDDNDKFVGLVNSTISMKDTHGVVFVTYNNNDGIRAYLNGEFQPNYYNENEAKVRDGSNDLVVYATQNGTNFIKAAVITFNNCWMYDLPGLPTTRDGDNFVILAKNATVEKTADGWVYTYTVYNPWTADTKTMTSVPFAYKQNQPSKWTVWNLKTNADGLVVAHEEIDGLSEDILAGPYYSSEAGIDMAQYLVTGFNMDYNQNITMTVADVNADEIETLTLNVNSDADVWLFDVNEDKELTAKNWISYVEYDYNNDPSGKTFMAYIDMNATTLTVNRLILMSGDWAVATAPETITVAAFAEYDYEYNKVRYTISERDSNWETFNGFFSVDANGNLYIEKDCDITAITAEEVSQYFPASKYVELTLKFDGVAWDITDVKANAGVIGAYDGANVAVVGGSANEVQIATAGAFNTSSTVSYKYNPAKADSVVNYAYVIDANGVRLVGDKSANSMALAGEIGTETNYTLYVVDAIGAAANGVTLVFVAGVDADGETITIGSTDISLDGVTNIFAF